MFIGRERELSKLNKMYQSEMFEFAFMSGLKLGIDTQKIDRITEQTSSIIFEETVENSK